MSDGKKELFSGLAIFGFFCLFGVLLWAATSVSVPPQRDEVIVVRQDESGRRQQVRVPCPDTRDADADLCAQAQLAARAAKGGQLAIASTKMFCLDRTTWTVRGTVKRRRFEAHFDSCNNISWRELRDAAITAFAARHPDARAPLPLVS